MNALLQADAQYSILLKSFKGPQKGVTGRTVSFVMMNLRTCICAISGQA